MSYLERIRRRQLMSEPTGTPPPVFAIVTGVTVGTILLAAAVATGWELS